MRTVIGVMGGAHADAATESLAREVGARIAAQGWVLLTGGRDCGVMAAASAGAAAAGGLVIGILPGDDFTGIAPGVDIAVLTGMGEARNAINVLTSHVVVAFPGGAGTISEVALALRAHRRVIVAGWDVGDALREAGGESLVSAHTPCDIMSALKHFLGLPDAPQGETSQR